MCVFLCVRLHICMHTHVCVCKWMSEINHGCHYSSTIHLSFWDSLSLTWSLLFRLDRQSTEPQAFPCLCLPSTRTKSVHRIWCSYMGSENQTQALTLMQQVFYWLCPLQPTGLPFYNVWEILRIKSEDLDYHSGSAAHKLCDLSTTHLLECLHLCLQSECFPFCSQ